MKLHTCPVCSSTMSVGLKKWHQACTQCGYESGDLISRINSDDKNRVIDEDFREAGLINLRKRNFNLLLNRINKIRFNGGNLLDVGCAHGWFLDIAQKSFRVKGIEPDIEIFTATKKRGLDVINGYFPDALDKSENFDLIVFNDVFEHIPNIDGAMEAIEVHLNQNGLLVINLPSSNGFFYNVSKILARIGVNGPFERMWQKGLPSPHLHYFNISNLDIFLKKHGFVQISTGNLVSVSYDGLFTRVNYAKKYGLIGVFFIYIAILTLIPVIPLMPKDIFYVIASRRETDSKNGN